MPLTRDPIDREWLNEQYVVLRRTLPEIASEKGTTPANVARYAKSFGILLRSRGGASHRGTIELERLINDEPDCLRPALVGVGGRERLRRFLVATQHATMTDAARALGTKQGALTLQIQRIERELGAELFTRAVRGRPMEVTATGAEVARAVEKRIDGWGKAGHVTC